MSGILPPMAENRTSRLSGFYQKSIAERVAIVTDWAGLSAEEGAVIEDGLQTAQADKMVENVIGRYSLPLGIATNLISDYYILNILSAFLCGNTVSTI